MPRLASIKVLNILLMLSCVTITAFLCTFLAISSSNKALDDTKNNRDASVSSCFMIGQESVTNRTVEYLDVELESVQMFLSDFANTHRRASLDLARELSFYAWDDVKMWGWHRLPRYFSTYSIVRPEGNTGTGFILANKLLVLNYERLFTIERPPDEYHHLEILLNYGTDHPWGGVNKTFFATNDGKGGPRGVTNPLTDVIWDPIKCNITKGILTNGTEYDDPCIGTKGWEDPTNVAFYHLAQQVPPGESLWTYPLPVSLAYISINCLTPIHINGVFSGLAFTGAHLTHVNKHLTSLQIGGPVDGHPSRGRVYITLRESVFDAPGDQVGRMIGASHGNTFVSHGSSLPEALHPSDSSDHIISSVANATYGRDLDRLASSGNLTVLNISTELAPDGEEFYYRVGRLYDNYGVDWYVHLVIDRAYILGSIDEKVVETRAMIKETERNVDKDLHEAQTILYVCVAAVAVGLTVLSVLFVLRIIEPLVVLEREMAAVAVMRLEEIDINRPLSALEEVRLMQTSFLLMIQNLIEYKNYMPASVFVPAPQCEEEEEKPGEVDEVSGPSGDMSRIASDGGGSTGTPTTGRVRTNIANHDVRTKRVTLMICNIVSFLQVTEPQQILGQISKYLAAGQLHVTNARGMPESFSGDRLFATWNAVRSCPSHRGAAYGCAREMTNNDELEAKLSIGLASGEAKCGNMGCEGMKKYSYIGSLSSWVHVVERIGRSMECEVAIDAVVNEVVSGVAYTRILKHVQYVKHQRRPLLVYEAREHLEVGQVEWMYQLKEGESKDPYRAYNSSYELFMVGKVDEAKEMLGTVDDGSRVMLLYRERLQKAATNHEACEPVGKIEALYY